MGKKQQKWTKRRHAVITAVAKALAGRIILRKYGAQADRFQSQGTRAYLVLYNHQTPADQFFVAMSFSGAVYYMATEDIFSKGPVSSLLRFAVAPIPIVKQTTDLKAVKTCLKVAKEGGTIAIAPEGNRTYSGRTEYMNPAIGGLAKKLGLPIALYRIEGGYGVQPRWSDGIRKGRMHAYVSRVIEPEEYASLSADELFSEIRKGLFVDEACPGGPFVSEHKAEYLERAIYVCPTCGLSAFESSGSEIVCRTCGRAVLYGEDKRLTGKGFDFPFAYVGEWYEYQKAFVRGLDLAPYAKTPMFCDVADLYEVTLNKKKRLLKKAAAVRLYGDRVEIDADTTLRLPFSETQAAALGRNKLNLYHDGQVYQFKGSKRFNALKYVNICYHCKNIDRGNEDGEFLGL